MVDPPAELIEGERVRTSEIDSDEEFWNSLPAGEARRERLRELPIPPARDFRCKARTVAICTYTR